MRKKYPYLEEPYVYNLNEEQQKRSILGLIDDFINQRQYVNMTLLDWEENPLKSIQGIISSGSISKDGSSSVRRSCSLSCSVSKKEYNIDSMEMDFALNKKIFIEIGIKNETKYYPDFPIFWFPQGVFYIDSFSMNSATSSAVNLSINLKDKMCLLNGMVGGTLPATVQFDTMTTQLADGTITEQKVLYYNIIRELVHHWGGEDLNNIIIQDVPLRIRRTMQWNNSKQDLYLTPPDINGVVQVTLDKELFKLENEEETEDSENKEKLTWNSYSLGDRVGYVYDDFVPVSEITGAAGDTVCTILDTIKNNLGNYEYFYDVFGIFHFREIKNYLNINQSTIILQESGNPGRHINLQEGQFLLDTGSEKQYLIETTNDKNVYTFDSDHNVTSISVTPNYSNIKNDFIVDGIRKSENSDSQFLVRYRLVIDDKPEIQEWMQIDDKYKGIYGKFDNVLYYTYPEYSNGKIVNEVNKLGFWYDNFNTDEQLELPSVGNMDQIYRMVEDGENVFYLWTGAGYHKLYLKDNSIDAASNIDWLFIENTTVENANNSETQDNTNLIQSLRVMLDFIQGKADSNNKDAFLVEIENEKYFSYDSAYKKDKIKTLDTMNEFFKQYVNTLPYSSILSFLEYEKLSEKEKEEKKEKPLYNNIESIESLLLDKIETLKSKEQIITELQEYIKQEDAKEETDETAFKNKNFYKQYPNTLDLSSLLNWCDGDVTIYHVKEQVKNYLKETIDELSQAADPKAYYQVILDTITDWPNEEIEVNESIESTLDFLVGEKDVLNPTKYTNYDDLREIYVAKTNLTNTYNNLKTLLEKFHDNDYLRNLLEDVLEETPATVLSMINGIIEEEKDYNKKFPRLFCQMLENTKKEMEQISEGKQNIPLRNTSNFHLNIVVWLYMEKEIIWDFHNRIEHLVIALRKAIKQYELRDKLSQSNQNTDDEIKFKPIIYSDTLGYPNQNNSPLGSYYVLDWRTYLYLYGQYANVMGTDPGPYFSDLEAFWPYEYNLNRDKQCFMDELGSAEVLYKQATNGNFFFDMIDANSSSLGEFSVKNIGRRIDVVNDESINCLFEPEIPDVVFLNMDNPDANWSENTTVKELRSAQEVTDKLEEQRQECINNSQPYVQVSDEIYNNLTTGRYLSDAYEQIKYELFAHLKYQKVVSITALPAYYLEPNSRVTLKDYSTNIYGDYMIQNLNIALGPGPNMSVTLNEVSERL